MREGHGELAGRAVVAEEDVGQGVAAFFAGVELLDEGGGCVGDPVFGDGLTRAENYDGWRVGVYDCAEEGAHCSDEVEVGDIDVLAGCLCKNCQ